MLVVLLNIFYFISLHVPLNSFPQYMHHVAVLVSFLVILLR